MLEKNATKSPLGCPLNIESNFFVNTIWMMMDTMQKYSNLQIKQAIINKYRILHIFLLWCNIFNRLSSPFSYEPSGISNKGIPTEK